LFLALLLLGGEAQIRSAVAKGAGTVRLPAGVIEIASEIRIPDGARDLEILGAPEGTVLRAAAGFEGRAVLSCRKAVRIRFSGFTVDGNRASLEKPIGLPPYDVAFVSFYRDNGLLVEDVESLTVRDVRFVNVANFPILVGRSKGVRIERVRIEDSGSRGVKGRNNTTGGILLEEGTADFDVADSVLERIRGNGVWTHSLYTSPRNGPGSIRGNRISTVGRDAIQVGHATGVKVEGNQGKEIGFPASEVDMENRAIPVAIDTAGNVDRSAYNGNRFEEINGKCIDLDGFHDGEVRRNECVNRRPAEAYPYGNYGIVMNNSNPDMQSERIVIAENIIDGALFGGIFVIGSENTAERNILRNLNLAHCNENAAKAGCYHAPGEPDMLQAGIYLGKGAERPALARRNRIRGNRISGYRMKTRCIAFAPGVESAANTVEGNLCDDGERPER
jgi:hypothetical protein